MAVAGTQFKGAEMSAMMKVRLLTSRATATEAHEPGAVLSLPRAEALRRIDRGEAQPVRKRQAERAVPAERPERAVR